MGIREEAKKIYLHFKAQGAPITLKELAERSEELLDQKISYEGLGEWAEAEGWTRLAFVEDETNPNLLAARELLDRSFNGMLKKDTSALDTTYYAKAYLAVLRTMSRQHILEYAVLTKDVRDMLYAAIGKIDVKATVFSSAISSWATLRKFAAQEYDGFEDGEDPDELLLLGDK